MENQTKTLISLLPSKNQQSGSGRQDTQAHSPQNVNPTTGKLDNARAVLALMTHRNTPSQQTGNSPAMTLFGQPIRDHLPLSDLRLRKEWHEIADK